MKPKYDKYFHLWCIPTECWNQGISVRLFRTRTAAIKAINLYKKLGRTITPSDLEQLDV